VTAPATIERQPLDPRVRHVWRLSGAIGAAPFVVAALVAAGIGAAGDRAWLTAVGVTVAVALVVIVVVVPGWRHRTWSWALTDEGLEVAHGVVVRTQSAIPTFRVQQVDVKQGPIERMFGLVTLQITTASAASDGTLPGIDAARADEVRRRILGRVAADDGV
jgi:membrane protein YdbS with pleckstrin-like domain